MNTGNDPLAQQISESLQGILEGLRSFRNYSTSASPASHRQDREKRQNKKKQHMVSKWNYQPLTHQQKQEAEKLLSRCGGIPAIAELLVRRGVSTPEEADAFFAPSISDLCDPFLMNDMDKAVNRLNKAMGAKERIIIYGDYHVDGTTAVALVY